LHISYEGAALLHWYALHVKPNAEYLVVEILESRSIETYLPTLKSLHPRPGHTTTPYFPSYLFARIDFEVTAYAAIAWTPGIRGVVAVERRPAVLEDEVIQALRERVDQIWAAGGLPTHTFQPGDRVRIREGALQGLMGVFDGPTTPTQRVRILLNFLGRARPAEVPVDGLELASADDTDPLDLIEIAREREQARLRRGTRGKGRTIRYHKDAENQDSQAPQDQTAGV
jgi:transcriptional antiterminator RfaH